jgi:hypothetical protein
VDGSSCNNIEFVEVIGHPGWYLSVILVGFVRGFFFFLEWMAMFTHLSLNLVFGLCGFSSWRSLVAPCLVHLGTGYFQH